MQGLPREVLRREVDGVSQHEASATHPVGLFGAARRSVRLGWPENEVQRCVDLVVKLKGHALAAEWRAALEQGSITVDRLCRALARRPEAA